MLVFIIGKALIVLVTMTAIIGVVWFVGILTGGKRG